jgi:uncharacterized protein YcfJ
MTRLSLSILVVALAACAGAASAQDYARPYGDAPYGDYPHRNAPAASPPSQHGAHYDWARVLRVDPVFDANRTSPMADGRNCVTRRDSYAGGDPYRDDPYRHDPYGNDPYRNDPYRNDPYRNDPYRSERHRDPGRDDSGRTVATVLGGIAGAVLGSRIGDGSGQYIGTAVGTMVGGMAGRGIYDANRRQREVLDGYVTTCDPEPYYGDGASTYGYGQHVPDRAISEYDVTYEYAGREYVTRTRHHPGERIRVRVDVRAE